MLTGWKTLIGLAIAAIGQSAKMAGIDMGDLDPLTDAIGTSLDNMLVLVGLVVAAYGRLVAKTPVGGEK